MFRNFILISFYSSLGFTQVNFNTTAENNMLGNAKCREFLEFAENEINTTGLTILKDGQKIYENYLHGANEKTKTKVWSISKFLSGLTLGTQVKKHGMELLDRPLTEFGLTRQPSKKDLYHQWENVTVRNIWNMSSGINWCEYRNCNSVDAASIMYGKGNKNALEYVLKQPLIHAPGTYYRYSSGNFILLQAVLKNLVGSDKYDNLVYDEVLAPLGIEKNDYAFERDQMGLFLGGSGLSLTTRGLAKLGQLILNKGIWEGNEILSREFFEEMTRNSNAIKNSPFYIQNWEGPSGGAIWLNDDSTNGDGLDRNGIPSFMPTSPFDMIYAGGNWGQYLLVYPKSKMVIVRVGGDTNSSSLWKPFSEKALSCFAPSELREDVPVKEEKKPPQTGKKPLGLFRILGEKILTRSRAQELCTCLFVSGYDSVEKCDLVMPTKIKLFGKVTSHNIVKRPIVDYENYSVTVKGLFGTRSAISKLDPKHPEFGCSVVTK